MASFVDALLEELKKQGKLTENQIQEIKSGLKNQKKGSLEDYFLKKGQITSEDLAKARAKILEMEVAPVSEGKVPFEILEQLPEEIAQRYQLIPFHRQDGEIWVGMVQPEDIEAEEVLDFLERSRKIKIKRFVISRDDFQRLVKQRAGLETEVEKVLSQFGQEEEGEELKFSKEDTVKDETELKKLAEQAPITRVVRVILKYAVDNRASDIHIEPISEKVQVRFRIDGDLHASLFLPKDVLSAIVTRVKILAKLKIDESRIPQDGRIQLRFDERQIDFRVSTFPTSDGEKVVLRVLDISKGIMSLEELGLQAKALSDIKAAMKRPFGTTLISGPTGSGKTTTLYSVLKILNTEDVNIVTLEDPVEYYLEGVNQSQIRPGIGYSFATGLRHILRQDPDIIMVGEIRDSETAGLAIHAALTGHLVFSTIHTNNAIGVIPRLIDMGVDDFLLPSALTLAVAQRLLGKLCNECKKSYDPPEKVKKLIASQLSSVSPEVLEKLGVKDKSQLWRAKGCHACNGRGTKGRIAAFETLFMTPGLEAVIVDRPTESAILKEAQRQGMITMRQDGIIKALKGIVGLDDVLRATED
jgi:type IV pilus assembly protein PilB